MRLGLVIAVAACTTTSGSGTSPPCDEMTDVTCAAAAAPCTLAAAQADHALCPALVQFCGDTATVFESDGAWSYVYGSDGNLISVTGQPTPACATGPATFQVLGCASVAFPTTACSATH